MAEKVQVYDCKKQAWFEAPKDGKGLVVIDGGQTSSFGGSEDMHKSSSAVFTNKTPSSYGQGYGGTSAYTYVACKHFPEKPLFSVDGINIFGAEKPELREVTREGWEKALFVNCTGSAEFVKANPKNPIKVVPEQLKSAGLDSIDYAFASADLPDELVIDWNDRGMPELKVKWWMELIKAAKAAGYEEIVFFCFGGHGRTGTALAALIVCSGQIKDPYDAMEWVHKNHCSKAIEGERQETYIKWCAKLCWGWEEPVKVKK